MESVVIECAPRSHCRPADRPANPADRGKRTPRARSHGRSGTTEEGSPARQRAGDGPDKVDNWGGGGVGGNCPQNRHPPPTAPGPRPQAPRTRHGPAHDARTHRDQRASETKGRPTAATRNAEI